MTGAIGKSGALALLLLASACATGGPGPARSELRATLTGLQEVPGPGDPDGTGTALVRVNATEARVCWELYARGIEPATAAHIHRGAAGSAGPPVVPLATPGADGRSEGCASVERGLAREMALRPYDFYVNVHNRPYPAGAIRGQLRGRLTPNQRQGGGR